MPFDNRVSIPSGGHDSAGWNLALTSSRALMGPDMSEDLLRYGIPILTLTVASAEIS